MEGVKGVPASVEDVVRVARWAAQRDDQRLVEEVIQA